MYGLHGWKLSCMKTEHLSYKDAGVDIHAADAFVEQVGKLAKSTHTAGVVPHRNEYASLFRLNVLNLQDPMLAVCCDGVGTKLLVARQVGKFEGLGQDLVAMNVNDLLPSGAQPLLFLDYIATGKLDVEQMTAVVRGIANACKESGCALIGGETAEMPGLYPPGDFDLAGFAVGLVDGARVPHLQSVEVGDVILAMKSSGIHANGMSLARKALEQGNVQLSTMLPELGALSVGETLLIPTSLYVRPVLDLMQKVRVKSAAHITGGGLLGRVSRLTRPGQRIILQQDAYDIPPIFDVIAKSGHVTKLEMSKTFNMGLGYVIVVDADSAAKAQAAFPGQWQHVGEVVAGEQGVDLGYASC